MENFGFKILFHDLDKLFERDRVAYKEIHRRTKRHHLQWMLNNKDKIKIEDVFEMICDWESSRFSKPNKQKTAHQYAMERMHVIKQLPLHVSAAIKYYSNHIKS